ncbi:MULTISPECIES: hypothetical protein [Methylosinus]|jgi:hypothetical protein|uniref:hypothetical protein n=1 Tax=Methylosinus TaxID=425 RepID=UPI00037A5D50|nr:MULTISPECIES: hypothetical protein [unclassified Methylosinus]OAI30975.1 hypothetical protein A1351_06710 [Methylosinus sp. R-45379]TDX63516.1 hypothetical protein EDE12_107158 [Methylosinus sp. sav-2]
MESCEQPLASMTFCEAVSCVWAKGETALNSVLQTPATASIGDWALTLLVGLVLLNLVIMLFRAAFPRRRFDERVPTSRA